MNGCKWWSPKHRWRHKCMIVPAEKVTTNKPSKFIWYRACDVCGVERNLVEW